MRPGEPIPEVVEVQVPEDFVLRLRFGDGKEGLVDLRSEISTGDVFVALRDPEYFRRVTVDHEIRTVIWPNGVALAPEVLYQRATSERAEASGSTRP